MHKIDYEKDSAVDKHTLDDQLEEQARIHIAYGKAVGEAESDMLRKKREIVLIEAEMFSEIKKDPDKYSIEKVTDKAITSEVAQTEEVKQAHEDYFQAVENYKVCNEALSAIAYDRKSALESLKDLWLGSYWSTQTKVPNKIAEKTAEENGSKNIRKMKREKQKKREN